MNPSPCLEANIDLQLIKKFVALYDPRRFITVLTKSYSCPYYEPYKFSTYIHVTFLKTYFNIIPECTSLCSKQPLSFKTLSRNSIYVLNVHMLHALNISSYSSDHPNNFRNEHKLIALITLRSSPPSGFFSFFGQNTFRRTAEVNDNLKAMVITNEPIKAAGTM